MLDEIAAGHQFVETTTTLSTRGVPVRPHGHQTTNQGKQNIKISKYQNQAKANQLMNCTSSHKLPPVYRVIIHNNPTAINNVILNHFSQHHNIGHNIYHIDKGEELNDENVVRRGSAPPLQGYLRVRSNTMIEEEKSN